MSSQTLSGIAMNRHFLAVALVFIAINSAYPEEPPVRRTLLVRIDGASQDELLKTGILTLDEYHPRSLISVVRDTALAIMTRAETDLLRERGFRTSVVMEDTSELQLIRRAAYGPSMRLEPPYHSYTEIVREIDSLRRTHPALLSVTPLGFSVRNKQIVAARISGNAAEDTGRPAILFNGCHHSNEVLGAEICMAIIHELVEKYGKDSDVTRWVDNFEIYVVPVVNVDGHDLVTSGYDPRWRKNARDTDSNGVTTFPDGVDLNRTYDFNWAHGGASDALSGRYRGPYPFSEPETRALADFTRKKRFLLSITYHSQGEVIYYPWNWGGRKAPDDQLLTSIARGLAGSIKTMKGDTCYKAEYGAGLVGQSYTWLYGALGTFDFVVETGRGASIFPPYEVPGIVHENLGGAHFILKCAEGPGALIRVKDAVTRSPIEAQVWFPSIETEDVQRRTTHVRSGTLRRLLLPGTYTCIVTKPGYHPVVLNDVVITSAAWTTREVILTRVKP
jgi:hypothetical protein